MLDSDFNSNFDSKKFSKGNVEHVKMGMNKVMADCVVHSKDIVPYDTGTLHNSIQIQDFAEQNGKSIIGRWGSRGVNYAIFVEFGTIKMSAQPYLRPSADRFYRQLENRVKEFAGYE